MPENVEAVPELGIDGGPALGAAGVAGAGAGDDVGEPGTGAPPPAPQPSKNVVVPTAAMKRIKEEEYAKGKQAALEQIAKDAGYESHADFVAALARLRSSSATTPQQAPPSPAPPKAQEPVEDPAKVLADGKEARREEGRFQRQLEKVLTERNKYAQSAANWQQKAREAQAEADAVRAEMHLRTVAAGVGVQDIDYAITLFSREVEKLSPEQVEKFDERVFFDGLRKTKPLLFGEVVQPATTGTGGGPAPAAPKPGAVAAQNGANGKVDAKKLTPQDFGKLLAQRGINPHAS